MIRADQFPPANSIQETQRASSRRPLGSGVGWALNMLAQTRTLRVSLRKQSTLRVHGSSSQHHYTIDFPVCLQQIDLFSGP